MELQNLSKTKSFLDGMIFVGFEIIASCDDD
jgi:hypothetical protein